jgi:methylenetetrahydrofolate reductase (NADPH)
MTRFARLVHRERRLAPPERAALLRLLAQPTFELLPIRGVDAQLAALPMGARVSITASPRSGLQATLDLAGRLQEAGRLAVPHIAARMVRDRAHVADILAQLHGAGILRAFVIAGDAPAPGEYPGALSLLRAMAEVGPLPPEIGVACYPDGHPFIAREELLASLRAKAPFAAWMTTQMCFEPVRITTWLAERRTEGIALPAVIGVPGVTEPRRLLTVGARIGVRGTSRFVRANAGWLGRLLRSGGFYRPEELLAGLAPAAATGSTGISGLHLYTFNEVARTEAWCREYRARLLPGTA